jgi:carboxyl-terminal processing protease
MVVTPIAGGPSDLVGIMPGDRIVKVEGKNVAGIASPTAWLWTSCAVLEKRR